MRTYIRTERLRRKAVMRIQIHTQITKGLGNVRRSLGGILPM